MIIDSATATLPTKYGTFTIHSFTDDTKKEHLALVKGRIQDNCLVRIHSECLTGDVFHSLRCDCRAQLEKALELIGTKGGVIVYLRQEGRNIGLTNKVKTYKLQEQGFDTVDANRELGFQDDERTYEMVAEILKKLQISQIQLLTNNPDKIVQLQRLGITTARVPLTTLPTEHNHFYLNTKKEKMGHVLTKMDQKKESVVFY